MKGETKGEPGSGGYGMGQGEPSRGSTLSCTLPLDINAGGETSVQRSLQVLLLE